MGYIRHNAVIVTAAGYDEALQALERAHRKAQELFGPLVTPVVESVINGYRSFFVAPDGGVRNLGRDRDEVPELPQGQLHLLGRGNRSSV